ncbi:MAG: pilin [Patescibacteria group bacterium]|jgi:hypothetical protein
MREKLILFAIDNPFPNVSTNDTTLGNVLNMVYAVVGAICVLMITFGGFKYVMSRGEPAELAKAKDTILYAVIGVAVVMFAFTITRFVVKKL